jgi:hypothetical protein
MAGERILDALARAHALPVTMAVKEVDELRRLVMTKLQR